jgi:hypothetical protein
MNLISEKIKKALGVFICSILIVLVIVLIFLSSIAKYVIEKYDVEYLGREVTLNRIFINPFSGKMQISDLRMQESNSKAIFFSAEGIDLNFELNKLFKKEYIISEFTLDKPVGVIIQNKKVFNFSDLIDKFTAKDTLKIKKGPVKFSILNIKINDGTFFYAEKNIPVNYYIKNVSIESSGMHWDVDSVPVKFHIESGVGTGTLTGESSIHLKSMNFKLDAHARNYDLSTIEQYIKEMTNYGKLRANLDADLKATGNFKNSQVLDASGSIAVNDLHFGKTKTEDYLSFKKFTVKINQLNPINKKYLYDSVSLLEPFFKYERYDHLDNLQNMFGKKGKKVKEAKAKSGYVNILFKFADYIKEIAKNFFRSKYEIKRLAIYKADLKYYDYAINEKFEIAASPLTIIADSIDRSSDRWVNLSLRSGLKPYGNASLDLSINPKDSSDFNVSYRLYDLPAAMFNPYLITFTSFPLDKGTMEMKGRWNVNNGIIKSTNHFLMIDPRVNERQKRDGARWIPLKLIMFFVRENGNVIDYEIPINGDLKDPKFKLKDVIIDVLTNLFVKPVTTPYRIEVKNVENKIERSIVMKWEMRKSILQDNEVEFVKKLADHLKENPAVNISVIPINYSEKEKEYILFFEAKKLFYQKTNGTDKSALNGADSAAIERLAIKDSTFLHYLDKHVGNKLLFTVQDKCEVLVGAAKVNAVYKGLKEERKNKFISYFKGSGTEKQLTFLPEVIKTPYNGFSNYRIDYKGEWPEDIRKAYEKLMDFNNKSPRDKFSKERERNRKFQREK